ncbi:MAG: hypothetical protein MJ193_04930 [Clostridia bacterium]|nr:hypothetical protein [Clostridia bacterium]
MNKFVPMEKRSKKEQKEYNKRQRSVNGFNTGTRVMKTKKRPTRAMQKDAIRKGKED